MANNKETIYIDIDDEITTIIDKIKTSASKIVALVLPKRATVLQSVVNMRLLKRAAEDAKKNIVLITSDSGVTPLAGLVGLHVAKTAQSKPEIPSSPAQVDTEDTIDQTKTVGELADDEAIPVDNEDKKEVSATGAAAVAAVRKKKIKIPNFDNFRLKVVLGVLALLVLISGWVWAIKAAPRAKVTVKTATNTIDSELRITVNPDAKELNSEDNIVPGEVREVSKIEKETVPATGELDKGKKASGEVTLRLTNCNEQSVTVQAGTKITTDNLTYVLKEDATLGSVTFFGECRNEDFPDASTERVAVISEKAGEKYNIAAGKTFVVAGYSAVVGEDSSEMTGGTSKVVTIVSEKDVEDAKAKITDRSEAARDELLAEMEQFGLIGLRESFKTKTEPTYNVSPEVGKEADSVTVTSSATYSMLGISRDGLKSLVELSVQDKIDTSKQELLDNGIDEAKIILTDQRPNGEAGVTIRLTVLAGPRLDENSIKETVAGKKKGQAMNDVKARPGIESVQIDYSPFWVSVTPKNQNKITVIFEQNNTQNADQ